MEVTVENFEAILPEVEKAIDSCSFMAIDCELSGLKVTDDKDNFFETVEERYQSMKKSASEFLIVQFGLVTFFYNEEKDCFTHKAYNFYTFPRQSGRHGPNIRFLCESSSIEFLCSCGFDFNKLFYSGVPHLTYAGEQKMRDDLEKRQNYLSSEDSSAPIPVPEYLKKFMKETEETVRRFVASNKTEHFLENLNPFHRKLIWNNVKPKYLNKLYFETVSYNEPESVSESDKSDSEVPPSSKGTSNANSKTQPTSKIAEQEDKEKEKFVVVSRSVKKSTGGNSGTGNVGVNPGSRDKRIKITKVSEEEVKKITEEKRVKELQVIDSAIGFSKVIRKISQSNKIVVGHNMLLDVSHTISQFVDELPDNLADFKIVVQNAFPNIVDTKLMASTHPFRELMTSTVLFDLMKKLQSEPFSLPVIKRVEEEGAVGYDTTDEKHHEAGFDAFVTGVCFIGMAQYLGTLQNPPKPRVLPESPLVMPFLNKIYMMRMLDITYLNISGTDLTPSRSHVFYVTCPSDAVTKSIQDMFSPFGNVQTYWHTSTALFVALSDKDQAPLVMRTIECKNNFKVIPFEQYQKSMSEKKRPLTGDSPERPQDDPKKQVSSVRANKSSPPNGGQKKKRPKTESDEKKKEKASIAKSALVFDQPPSWD